MSSFITFINVVASILFTGASITCIAFALERTCSVFAGRFGIAIVRTYTALVDVKAAQTISFESRLALTRARPVGVGADGIIIAST